MKQLLAFLFIIPFLNLLSESQPLTNPNKADSKSTTKTVEAKTVDAKSTETKPAEPKAPAKAD
ncbi:MAG TPA: hypothetical protein PLL86_25825, partial [Leptospiraceae bacterium]|nr:hypothetical protein [Leptospiraceae bacterium]